ncbi:NAD-dependent epimerase/dehydratase family protein [Microbacterium sp. 179-I 3D4 NHS]|uniref:NAD-dependent epimerase/dehydratase family protein n=1 Tax=Microbacterium sp. 179-I 3D4 NHS TaxID=3142381 RepID=UPI00399FAFC5
MTKVLILGGSGWLSGRVARRWSAAGADVTCLTRGERPMPPGVAHVRGDRELPDAYAGVPAGDWDHVVDVSSRAVHVARAVDALGGRARRWTYVSSLSVYADDAAVGADESAPRHPPALPDEQGDYGREKVAAEDAVSALGDRALVVRPGLIVGAGDPSDRFGYWAAAFLRAGSGPVLLPPLDGRFTQVIHVDDLAAYIVHARASGPVNAVGDPHPLAEVVQLFRQATGHRGRVIEAAEGWLRDRDVEYWMGERSLPLWLPPDMPGFATRSHARYTADGGRLRPLVETVADVCDDEVARGIDRPRRAGLTRQQEVELLAPLGA